jgi:hypothetical protein
MKYWKSNILSIYGLYKFHGTSVTQLFGSHKIAFAFS